MPLIMNIIKDIDEINILIKKRKYNFSEIVIDLPYFTVEENKKYSDKINKYYLSCGCETGTYFMIFAILFATIISVCELFFKATPLLWGIIYSVIFVLISAIIGKLTGLLIAKIRLHKTFKKINKIYLQKHKATENKLT